MDRKEVLSDYYKNDCVEDGRLDSKHGQVEFITTTKYVDKYLKPGDRILEIGAGTGKYSLHYASKGYQVNAIEFVDYNIDILKSHITDGMNIVAEQGDALDLSRFADNTFDVTLVLGPIYHLYTDADINKAIDEAIRVTKKDGKIMIAFLTSDSIMINWVLKKHHFDRKGQAFDNNYKMINQLEEVFAAFYIDEFDNIMKKKNVEKLNIIATDGMTNHFKDIIDELTEYEYNEWINYHLSTCERRELQGYSNHMLYICKKN